MARKRSPLEYQSYMELTCYQCEKWGECQASNIEDCMRRDEEAEVPSPPEGLTSADMVFLKKVLNGKVTDDVNLCDADIRSARILFKQHLIDAWPIEGSDAPTEALFITDKGKALFHE